MTYKATNPGEYVGEEVRRLAVFMYEELLKVDVATEPQPLEELHVAPLRPRTGMIVLADGSDWDPGSGQGFYGYYGGAWNKLG